jgi:hypothetical protein
MIVPLTRGTSGAVGVTTTGVGTAGVSLVKEESVGGLEVSVEGGEVAVSPSEGGGVSVEGC